MARLRIELHSPRSALLRTEIRPDHEGSERQEYKALLPDETVSSWVGRHCFLQLTSDDMDERSFGTLEVDLPAAPRSLLSDLRNAAKPPDAWMLWPWQRTLHCARCLAEDWVSGLPPYERRAWAVAWRTCCPRHGMLFEAERNPVPTWPSVLTAPFWSGDEIAIVPKCRFSAVPRLGLHGDRRAIHLESALAKGKRRTAWFPQGFDGASLRTVYQAIVTDLLGQFSMETDGTPEEIPNKEFNRQRNANRFAVNALVEAILSKWTDTPLPDCASAQRTDLLVRAIGWGEERPVSIRRGQVLFPGPCERFCELTRYKSLLRSNQYQKLSNPAESRHQGYFTLSEARQLDLNIEESLRWLAGLTRGGQFLAFDATAGCLTENPALPEVCRLQPGVSQPDKLLLPAWVFSPPKIEPQDDLMLIVIESKYPDIELRWKARRRRWNRDSRRVVRFQHSTQTNDSSLRS